MKKLITGTAITTIFVLMLNAAGAQTLKISGVVNDNNSKQPLPNASVLVKGISDSSFNTTVITNNKGTYNFSVPIEGFYKIEINYLGYTMQTLDKLFIDAAHTVVNTFYMVLSQKDLAEVTVNSKKPFISVAANKITLNVAQSAIAAGGNAYEVIKRGPGVTEQGDNLSFRGKTINVLINGRPSNLIGEELKTLLTGMPAATVEKVEILPNPSAKYDAQGGSVVNIVLTKNKAYGTNYILNAGLGSGRYLKGNTGLDINHRSKNINIYGGYSFMHNLQFYDNSSSRIIPNGTINATEYEERKRNNNAYKAGLDYDINKKSAIGFLVNGSVNYRNRKVDNNSILHYNGSVFDSTANVNTTGDATFNRTTANAYYKTTLSSTGKELTLNADYMHYQKKWNDEFTNRFYDNDGKEYTTASYIRDNSPATINVYSFAADYVQPLKKGKLEMGLKTNFTTTDNNVLWENDNGQGWVTDAGKTNHFIYKENVNAVYTNYITTLKKWDVQGGIRLEQTNTSGNSATLNQVNKKNYFDWFPNLSLQYTKNDNNIFGLTYRKTIRRYDFNYVNPFIIYQNQYGYSQGNPNIVPSKSNAVSFTYIHGEKYSAGIDLLYSNKFLGDVFKNGPNNILIQTYENLSKAYQVMPYINVSKQKGVWSANLYVSGGYGNVVSLNASKAKINNETWLYMVGLDNNFSFKKGWAIQLSSGYNGPVAYGLYRFSPQFTTDFGISKPVFKNKVSLKLSVSDIFNSTIARYKVNTGDVIINAKNKVETRFINLSFRYKFGNTNVKTNKNRNSKLSDIQSRIN